MDQALPVTGAQALEALDQLEASARGDEPFNHFAAPLLRQFIEQQMADGVKGLQESSVAQRPDLNQPSAHQVGEGVALPDGANHG